METALRQRCAEAEAAAKGAVERERIAAYAEATNDEHPAHRAGDLAPPVFAIVPVDGYSRF